MEKHYIQTMSSEDMQKRYVKVVEWYGGKEAFNMQQIILLVKKFQKLSKSRKSNTLKN